MNSLANDIVLLGSVLRQLREELGISQEMLGMKASLHRTYIGGVERGERNPSFISLNRILSSLEVSWATFGKKIDLALSKRSI